jgi:hypothetical protein
MIKLTKKSIELLDAVTSVPYSREGLGYTIGHGLMPSYLMKALKYKEVILQCYFQTMHFLFLFL